MAKKSLTPSDRGPTPFAERVRASFARQGAMAHLGAVLEVVQPGHVEISLAFRPELAQQHGFFHAGMQTLMAVVGRAGVKD